MLNPMISPLILALCANVSFATATFYFAEYSRRISAMWVNFIKALIAVFAFAIACTILGAWTPISPNVVGLLILSGTCGLFIGDIFLLKAFSILGSGRVLMIFGFQPLLLGFAAHILFNQELVWYKFIAVLFLIACLFTFSLESFKSKGHWEVRGILYALIGVGMDAIGLLLTRQSFELSPGTSPFQVNFIRSLTTVVGFCILAAIPAFKFNLWSPWRAQSAVDKKTIFWSCFAGAFVSLSFYLYAIKFGQLATVTAVTGTSPLFATLFETVRGKKKMTWYLGFGTLFFVAGFLILVVF